MHEITLPQLLWNLVIKGPSRLLLTVREREGGIHSEPYLFPVDSTGTAYTRQELIGVVGQNVTNPKKFWLNLRHPISEWIHTAHNFYDVPGNLWINEHYLFSKLITVDVLRADEAGNYYGKAQQTGTMFSLVKRIYATSPAYEESLVTTLKEQGVKKDLESIMAGMGNLRRDEPLSVPITERLKAVGIAAGYAALIVSSSSREISHHYSLTPELHPFFRLIRQSTIDVFCAGIRTAFTGKDYLSQAYDRKQAILEKANGEFKKASATVWSAIKD